MIIKIVLTILNLKPIDIAKELHISKSLVSKYIAGERGSSDLDTYFIQQIFSIDIKGFNRK